MIEAEVGQGKDNFWVTLGEMVEVVVDQDKFLEQVPIETKLDVSNVGNVVTLLKIVQTHQRQKKDQTEQMQQMLDSEEHETALIFLKAETYEGLNSMHSKETMDYLHSWIVRMHFCPFNNVQVGQFYILGIWKVYV